MRKTHGPTPSARQPACPGAPVQRHPALTAIALLGALAAGPALAQTSPVYAITALPLTGFTAFNDSGLILGRAFLPCSGLCTQSDSPVLYDTRTGTLTPLGGSFGAGVPQYGALNSKGQLAGTTAAYDASGALVRGVAIRQPDGSVTTLVAPALATTQNSGLQARGLNANGQIALAHSEGLDAQGPICGNAQGWIGTGATAAGWQMLGPSTHTLWLSGLNAYGMAVGAAAPTATCGGVGGGFRAVAALPSGSLTDLHGSMPGSFSRAKAINDLNYAVGDFDTGARTQPDAYFPQGRPITHAAVWNAASSTWYDLGPANAISLLNAANNRGEVVGVAVAPVVPGQPYAPASARAMVGNLATNAPMVDLNTLLVNNTGGWVVQEAVAINAAGRIIARGTTPAGSGYAVLTPLTAPFDPYATAPTAPANLLASQLTGASAVLTWTNTARNATRLVVERCKGSGCTGFAAVASLPADTARFNDAGLARRTTYRWRVRAGNAAGLSVPGNVVAATTLR